jgi:hypothetical protein
MHIFHSIIRRFQSAGPSTDWLINRDLRVAYRPISKNANSFLKAVFLLNHPLARDYDPSKETALRYLERSDKECFFAKSRELDSAGLSRFTVLRCPVKRFVSAYCDKILKPSKADGVNTPLRNELCRDASTFLGKTVTADNVTFSAFLAFTLSLPDSERDRHYRSQSSFLDGQFVDHYFSVEKLDEAIQYLCRMGFDPGSITSASSGVRGIVKKTAYRPDSSDHLPHLGNTEASRIRNDLPSMELPGFGQLFSKATLEQFLESYAPDVRLFCGTQGYDENAYRDGLLRALGDA